MNTKFIATLWQLNSLQEITGCPLTSDFKHDVKNQFSAGVFKKQQPYFNHYIQTPAPGECVVRKSGRSGLMPTSNMIDSYSLSEGY